MERCHFYNCSKKAEVKIYFDYTKDFFVSLLFQFKKDYNTTAVYCLKHGVWIRKNDKGITEVIGGC
jgi:hypothetical protein